MFGDLMGNMEQQQKELQEKLAKITVDGEVGRGAIRVTANGNGQLLNIAIDKSKLDWSDSEEVEDLLLIAANRALAKSIEMQAIESEKMLQQMMPPGLGNLRNLFGK